MGVYEQAIFASDLDREGIISRRMTRPRCARPFAAHIAAESGSNIFELERLGLGHLRPLWANQTFSDGGSSGLVRYRFWLCGTLHQASHSRTFANHSWVASMRR